MARKANEKELQKAVQLLHAQPGYKSGEYARMMGCHRQTFTRLLVLLNDRKIFFSEDGKGRLWPFGRNDEGT